MKIGVIIAWIGLLVAIVQGQGSCHDSQFELRKNLNSKTPYYPQQQVSEHVKAPEGCKLVQVQTVIRHGTRNPKDDDIEELGAFAHRLQNQYKDYIPKWLRKWQVPFPIAHHSQLVESGRLEMKQIALRLRLEHPNFFPSRFTKDHFRFLHTSKNRTYSSAISFADGLFKDSSNVRYETEPKGKDNTLKFYENCQKYIVDVDENEEAKLEYNKYEKSSRRHLNSVETLKKKLHLPKNAAITSDDLSAAFDGCSFEVAVNGIENRWCTLFSEDMIRSFDYYKDLKNYYKRSYGYKISYKSSSPLLQHIFHSMKAYTEKKSWVKGYFRFAHSSTVMPFMSLLGLKKNKFRLKADVPAKKADNRIFKSNKMIPFAGNVIFKLYECKKSKYLVKMLVNEKETKIPGCESDDEDDGSIYCPLKEFEDAYEKYIYDWDFEKECKV